MITLQQAILVEGKYDRMRLTALFDAPVLETGGFHLFTNRELQDAVKELARTVGVIVLTDADAAGRKIRAFIEQLAQDGRVYHAYVPAIPGKERRKEHPSAQGLLGVEGLTDEMIQAAVLQAVSPVKEEGNHPVTMADLYDAGLTGQWDSKEKRQQLLSKYQLPLDLSAKQLIKLMNRYPGSEEFRQVLSQFKKKND